MESKSERKKHINEIFLLRAVACLSIVLFHAIETSINLNISDSYSFNLIESIKVLLTFGTPTFVFISMLLISYSYSDNLPKYFLIKRAKLLLMPFLAMAIFYAFTYVAKSTNYIVDYSAVKLIIKYSIINILGGYHGYFILIIFQFYILCHLFNRYLSKMNPFATITVALIINLTYLAIFNYLPSPIDNKIVGYLWYGWFKIPFVAWVFYFVLAYYCGRNYDYFLYVIRKYEKIILVSAIAIGSTTIVLENLNLIPSSSKSVMMIFFTTSMIGVIYNIATRIKTIPYFFIKISQYSFSIYLIHMFYLTIMKNILLKHDIDFSVFSILFLFIVSIVASMLTAYIFNKFKFGKYLIGTINNNGAKLKTEKPKIHYVVD